MKPHLQSVPRNLPEPPYGEDVKANGFKPELDIRRIKQSRTWLLADSEVRPWLLMIWTEAWESTPAGSFEDDDELIAARIGCKYEWFQGHREQLMRGWQLHSDGRLYHSVVAGMVQEMLRRRKGATERKRRSRMSHDVTRDLAGRRVTYAKEQEQEQEEETHATHESARTAVPARQTTCPYEEIRRLWIEVLPELRQPIGSEHWTDARKAMIRNRWRDQLPDLESWRECFELVRKSDFLMGRTASRGRKPFSADLFWVSKPENLLKIYEGKYHA